MVMQKGSPAKQAGGGKHGNAKKAHQQSRPGEQNTVTQKGSPAKQAGRATHGHAKRLTSKASRESNNVHLVSVYDIYRYTYTCTCQHFVYVPVRTYVCMYVRTYVCMYAMYVMYVMYACM